MSFTEAAAELEQRMDGLQEGVTQIAEACATKLEEAGAAILVVSSQVQVLLDRATSADERTAALKDEERFVTRAELAPALEAAAAAGQAMVAQLVDLVEQAREAVVEVRAARDELVAAAAATTATTGLVAVFRSRNMRPRGVDEAVDLPALVLRTHESGAADVLVFDSRGAPVVIQNAKRDDTAAAAETWRLARA